MNFFQTIFLGLYRNSPLHKLMTFTLDINDVRHLDLLSELKIENEKYGRLYLPKLYLDINARRIAELEGVFIIINIVIYFFKLILFRYNIIYSMQSIIGL